MRSESGTFLRQSLKLGAQQRLTIRCISFTLHGDSTTEFGLLKGPTAMPLRFSIDIIFVEAEEELKTNTKSHNKINLINRFSRYQWPLKRVFNLSELVY